MLKYTEGVGWQTPVIRREPGTGAVRIVVATFDKEERHEAQAEHDAWLKFSGRYYGKKKPNIHHRTATHRDLNRSHMLIS